MNNQQDRPSSSSRSLSRRTWLRQGATAVAAGAALAGHSSSHRMLVAAEDRSTPIADSPIRQSVMGWCFNPMEPVELATRGKELGLVAIEGIGAEHYPAVMKAGLAISLVGSHGFANGPVSRDNHAMCVEKLREGIELAVKVGAPSVITFTGMSVEGMSDKTAMKNCIDCWKQVIELAEEKEITLCLEHLNSRDDSHPMKGHPGYFGDDVERCVDLIRAVDSPRMKLLFDVYHVQVMHGDVIRRLRQYEPLIGHYHTAGNPGRGELDDSQEINYPAVMKAIRDTGYSGYVAQEFIPTWDDPMAALKHAIETCAVPPANPDE